MTTKPKTRKAPAPKTTAPISSGDHGLQDRMAEIGKRLDAESENALRARTDAFMKLFADWLMARADVDLPRDEDTPDEEAAARSDRVDELARRITTTPVPNSWLIWHKFEVLEHYLTYYGESTSWSDNREVVMLAGIKADLLALLSGD
jgi:hypothetical protein